MTRTLLSAGTIKADAASSGGGVGLCRRRVLGCVTSIDEAAITSTVLTAPTNELVGDPAGGGGVCRVSRSTRLRR